MISCAFACPKLLRLLFEFIDVILVRRVRDLLSFRNLLYTHTHRFHSNLFLPCIIHGVFEVVSWPFSLYSVELLFAVLLVFSFFFFTPSLVRPYLKENGTENATKNVKEDEKNAGKRFICLVKS